MLFGRKRKLELLRRYLDGEMRPLERKRFEKLLSSDRELQELMERLERLDAFLPLCRLKKRPPELDAYVFNAGPLRRRERSRRSRIFVVGGSIAAIALLVFTFVAVYLKNGGHVERSPVAVSDTQEKGVALKTFRIKLPGARSVSVVGDFNAWNPNANPMVDTTGEGDWYAEVTIPEGAFSYQFLVDGKILIPDMNADNFLPDGFGGTDAVMVVVNR